VDVLDLAQVAGAPLDSIQEPPPFRLPALGVVEAQVLPFEHAHRPLGQRRRHVVRIARGDDRHAGRGGEGSQHGEHDDARRGPVLRCSHPAQWYMWRTATGAARLTPYRAAGFRLGPASSLPLTGF